MHLSRLALLLAGCALTALVSPARAQETSPSVPEAVGPQPLPTAPAIVIENAAVAPSTPAVVAIPAVWSPVPADETGLSAYGLYLSGRLAAFRGDNTVGAEFLARSQALTPEQPTLAEEAFRSGLFAGDLDTLAELAPAVQDNAILAHPWLAGTLALDTSDPLKLRITHGAVQDANEVPVVSAGSRP